MFYKLKNKMVLFVSFLMLLTILVGGVAQVAIAATSPRIAVQYNKPDMQPTYPTTWDAGKAAIIRVDWSELEPQMYGTNELEYDEIEWDILDDRIDNIGYEKLILLFHGTPVWRRKWPNNPYWIYRCSVPDLVDYDNYTAWKHLLEWTIDRYDPFAVLIWSEPSRHTADYLHGSSPGSNVALYPVPYGCMTMDAYIGLMTYTYDFLKDPVYGLGYDGWVGIGALDPKLSPENKEYILDPLNDGCGFVGGPYDIPCYDVLGMHDVAWFHDDWEDNIDDLESEISVNRDLMADDTYLWLTEAFYMCNTGDELHGSYDCTQSEINALAEDYVEYIGVAQNSEWPTLVTYGAMIENSNQDNGHGIVTYRGGLVNTNIVRRPQWFAWEDLQDWWE